MKISIIGAATTKFGELWDVSPRTLASQALNGALKDAEIDKKNIEALYVGNMLSGILGNQEHLGAFFADELGISGIGPYHLVIRIVCICHIIIQAYRGEAFTFGNGLVRDVRHNRRIIDADYCKNCRITV